MKRKRVQASLLVAVAWIIALLVWFEQNPINQQETTQQMQHEQVVEHVGLEKTFTTSEKIQEPRYQTYKDIPLPEDIQIYMQEVCEEHHISYEFALAMMESESSFKPDAVGDGGESVGYFQINRVNWEWLREEYNLDVQAPKDNITAGVIVIADLFEKYEDPYHVIICYKAGETRGNELYEKGIFKTSDYDCEAICQRAIEIEENNNPGKNRD